jgi:RecB family exonuclease
MEQCGAESDAVLARCVEELSVLIEAEENFADIAAASPFAFYVSHLNKKNYVYAGNSGGVNLYDYPVAAGTPYRCHLLLNASQTSASVEHRPLPFLRQDKRARLGLTDADVSEAMLSLYRVAPWKDYACHTRISAAEKTFSGWAIPHSTFAQNQTKANSRNTKAASQSATPEATDAAVQSTGASATEDLFYAEQQWRAGASAKPRALHAVQKAGFARWNTMLLEAGSGEHAALYSGGAAAELPGEGSATYSGEAARRLAQKIRGKNLDTAACGTAAETTDKTAVEKAELSVSASDLHDFFACPVQWLYKRIFRLEEQPLDASLLDAESLGLIYHRILHLLFERIKEADTIFTGEHLDTYSSWVEEISVSVLKSSDTLRGSLVYPLYASLGSAMSAKLRAFLKTEARYFDGFAVQELEQDYKHRRGRLLINGRIDRVSEDPLEGAMIVDYKTGAIPAQGHCRWSEEKGLLNFQMAMYIKLYEEANAKKISRALFAGIKKNEVVSVVGDFNGKDFSREAYEDTMDALDKAIDEFESAALSLSFTRQNTPYKTCSSCAYRTMCRSQYLLNPVKDRCARGFQNEEEDDEY